LFDGNITMCEALLCIYLFYRYSADEFLSESTVFVTSKIEIYCRWCPFHSVIGYRGDLMCYRPSINCFLIVTV